MLAKRSLFTLALTALLALALFGCGSQSAEPEGAPRTLEYFKPTREAPTELSRPAPAAPAESPRSQPTAVPQAMSEPARVIVEAEVEVAKEMVTESPAIAESVGPRGAAGPAGVDGAQGPSGNAGAPGPAASQAEAAPAEAPSPPVAAQSSAPAPTAAPVIAAQISGGGKSQPGATTFRDNPRNPAVYTAEDAVSTFSLDTDRTSYRLALNWARAGYEIDPDSVRSEEWINSFDYGYASPSRNSEFAIYTDVFGHPLDGGKHLARVAFQAPQLRDDSIPLNVTLVLDASGSMAEGNRVDIARTAAEAIRQSLRPQDRIAVVQFSETVLDRHTVEHTSPDHRDVRRSINRLQPTGATNVQAGLNLGVKLADAARRERPDAYNYVILMSDGVANVDATNPFAILETAGDYRSRNPIRLITIGVGIHNYNDYLLEQLAQHGNGWYRYLDDLRQAELTFQRENWLALALPFADQTRAQVTWNPDLVRSWRIVGYENRVAADEHFTQNRREFAEIPSGAATTVFYELELTDRVHQRSAGTAKLGDVELRWVEPATGASREQYAAVSGHWRQDFDSLGDSRLKLGALVALAADRYSALPGRHSVNYGPVSSALADLYQRLQLLASDLGNLTAYRDFRFLLEYLTRYRPVEQPRPPDSGYSP